MRGVTKRVLLALAVGGGAVLSAHAASFQANSNAVVELSELNTRLGDPQGGTSANPGQAESLVGLTGPTQSASAHASAYAAAGGLGVFAEGKAVELIPYGGAVYSTTTASSALEDSFVLNVAGYSAGTLALVTASVSVDGDMRHDGSGAYRYAQRWEAGVVAGSSLSGYSWSNFESNYVSCDACSNHSVMGTKLISFYAVVGAANVINLRLSVDNGISMTNGEAGFSSGTVDLSHTLAWGGISSVTIGGVGVSGYSAPSVGTGFDYVSAYTAAPVPEPASAALLAAGLLLLPWLGRRHRRG